MKSVFSAGALCVAFLSFGCSREVEELPPSEATVRSPVSSLPGSGIIPGYRHSIAASKFWSISPKVDKASSSFTRYAGDDRMMIVLPNGFVSGSTHANAVARGVGAYSTDSNAHNAHVVSYFLAAGMPADQMSAPHVTTRVLSVGTEAAGETARRLLGYTTVIGRVVEGTRIEGSFAWAEFNKNNETIDEQVWWPELPASIRDDVNIMKSVVGDSSKSATLRSKLPREVDGEAGEIVVHHEPPMGASFPTKVTLDFGKPGRPTVLSFDINGEPVQFVPTVDPVGDSRAASTAAARGTGAAR